MKASLLFSAPFAITTTPITAANRQLVVPASVGYLTHSNIDAEITPPLWDRESTFGPSPVVPMPVASLSKIDRFITLGHGPAIQTKPTTVITLQDERHPLTLGHGPVVVSNQTPMPSFTVERGPLTLVPDADEDSMPQPSASLLKKQNLFTTGHGPVTALMQAPTESLLELRYPFALGHGPVVSSKPISSSLLDEEHHFKPKHSPTTVLTSTQSTNARDNYAESTASAAPSAFASTGRESSPTKIARAFTTPLPENYSISRVKNYTKRGPIDLDSGRWSKTRQWLKSWTGWRTDYNNQSDHGVASVKPNYTMPGDRKPNVYNRTGPSKTVEIISKFLDYALTDCHPDSSEYVYFTVLSPDGELVRDSKRGKMLLYAKPEWSLTYPETLRRALLNDAEVFPGCPNGHCVSKLIPGTELRLEYVKNPHVFRANWQDGRCGYLDIQRVDRMIVRLGAFGYLYKGTAPDIRVVDFVEQQMLTTYPKLEIGLICVSIFGLISGIYLLYLFYVGSSCSWGQPYAIGRAITDGANFFVARVRNAEWNRLGGLSKHYGSTQDEFAEDCPLQSHSTRPCSPSLVNPPPAYVPVEPPRVFREIEELGEGPLESCMRDGMFTVV